MEPKLRGNREGRRSKQAGEGSRTRASRREPAKGGSLGYRGRGSNAEPSG